MESYSFWHVFLPSHGLPQRLPLHFLKLFCVPYVQQQRFEQNIVYLDHILPKMSSLHMKKLLVYILVLYLEIHIFIKQVAKYEVCSMPGFLSFCFSPSPSLSLSFCL